MANATTMSGAEECFQSGTHETCHKILHHKLFDPFFGVILLFNLSLVVVETDATARNELQPLWAEVMSCMVLGLFSAELVLRLYVLRSTFWFDVLNVIDCMFVTTDLSLNLLRLLSSKSSPFLQMCRLSKLARTAKALRSFPELRKMLVRLVTTFSPTFWRSMLVAGVLLFWSILAVQFIHPLNVKIAEGGEYEGCERCAQAYASISKAFFTFCLQIVAPDGWVAYIKPVIEHYPMSIIFYGAVFFSVAVGMINLFLGLVGDVASQLGDDLDDDLEYELLSERAEVQRHIRELRKLLGKDEFHTILGEMDIPQEDLRLLWAILDADNSGRRQAPYAFIAESIVLDWGLQNVEEISCHLQL